MFESQSFVHLDAKLSCAYQLLAGAHLFLQFR